jgi:hypothetical protein
MTVGAVLFKNRGDLVFEINFSPRSAFSGGGEQCGEKKNANAKQKRTSHHEGRKGLCEVFASDLYTITRYRLSLLRWVFCGCFGIQWRSKRTDLTGKWCSVPADIARWNCERQPGSGKTAGNPTPANHRGGSRPPIPRSGIRRDLCERGAGFCGRTCDRNRKFFFQDSRMWKFTHLPPDR